MKMIDKKDWNILSEEKKSAQNLVGKKFRH